MYTQPANNMQPKGKQLPEKATTKLQVKCSVRFKFLLSCALLFGFRVT